MTTRDNVTVSPCSSFRFAFCRSCSAISAGTRTLSTSVLFPLGSPCTTALRLLSAAALWTTFTVRTGHHVEEQGFSRRALVYRYPGALSPYVPVDFGGPGRPSSGTQNQGLKTGARNRSQSQVQRPETSPPQTLVTTLCDILGVKPLIYRGLSLESGFGRFGIAPWPRLDGVFSPPDPLFRAPACNGGKLGSPS